MSNKAHIPEHLTYEYIDSKLSLGVGLSALAITEGVARHVLSRYAKRIGIDIKGYTLTLSAETKAKMSKSAKLVAKDRLSDNFKFSQLGKTPSKSTNDKKAVSVRNFYNSIKEGSGNMFLYIIEQSGLIKIGVTNNFKERLQAITRDYGTVKKLLMVQGEYYNILSIEKYLHTLVSSSNVVLDKGTGRTEWFSNEIFTYCLWEVKEKFIDKGMCNVTK